VQLVVGYITDRYTAIFFAGVSTNVWSRARIVTSWLFEYREPRVDGSKIFVGHHISMRFISIHIWSVGQIVY